MGKCRVLLADDFEPDLLTYRHYLDNEPEVNYECFTAHSGQDTIDAYMRLKPDCLVLDYQFEEMNGLEVLERLQELTHSDNLPVLIVTGSGSQKIALQALKQGAQDYSIKCDLTSNTLNLLIQNTIFKSRLAQEVEHHKTLLAEKNLELERSNFELGMFANTACNEINTPVKLISAGLESLKPHLRPEALKTLTVLINTSQSLQSYLNGLLDWSKVRYNPTVFETFDLRQLANEVVADLAENNPSFKAVEDVQIVGNGSIEGDKAQIKQLVRQLIMNASGCHNEGGKVQVQLEIASKPNTSEVTLATRLLNQSNEYSAAERLVNSTLNGRDNFNTSRISRAISQIILSNHNGRSPDDGSNVDSELSVTLPSKQLR